MLKSVESTITSILDYEKDIEKQASPIVIMFSDLVGSTRYKAKNPVIDGLKRVFTYCKICANAITSSPIYLTTVAPFVVIALSQILQ